MLENRSSVFFLAHGAIVCCKVVHIHKEQLCGCRDGFPTGSVTSSSRVTSHQLKQEGSASLLKMFPKTPSAAPAPLSPNALGSLKAARLFPARARDEAGLRSKAPAGFRLPERSKGTRPSKRLAVVAARLCHPRCLCIQISTPVRELLTTRGYL